MLVKMMQKIMGEFPDLLCEKKNQIIKLWYNIIPFGGKEGKVNKRKRSIHIERLESVFQDV